MCINCLSHLESWKEFKQKCTSSDQFIQEYLLSRSKNEELNLIVNDTNVKIEDRLETYEEDSIFNDELNNRESDNENLSKSKLPISLKVM